MVVIGILSYFNNWHIIILVCHYDQTIITNTKQPYNHHQGTDLEVVEGEIEVDEGVRQGADVWQGIDEVSLQPDQSSFKVSNNNNNKRRTSPRKFSMRVTRVIKLSKDDKASSNVLKEIVKLSKEKYK